MFTGIVQAVGTIVAHEQKDAGARLRVRMPAALLRRLQRGDSIAVNGCCLTIVAKSAQVFTADLSRETLVRTSLAGLHRGDRVNIEPPLRHGDRLSGHSMQGHVEATGELLELTRVGRRGGWRMAISLPRALARFAVPQGTLAVDGISLTVAQLTGTRAEFAIIPFTHAHTNLAALRPGARVNLETDPIARHLARLLAARREKQPPSLTLAGLLRQGF